MVKTEKLRNDIQLIYEEVPGTKSVSFGIFVKMGSALENKENNGISHVIEHMIFKGTSKYSVKEMADIMSDFGGNINAYTSKENTVFYGRVLTEDFEKSIELMGQMLFDSSFNEKELTKEKHVILDEIDLYDDSAEDLCHELLQKKVWKNSAYGYIISGNRSTVKNFSRQCIVDTWKANYVPENIVISVAGGMDYYKVYDIVDRYFGGIPKGGQVNEYPVPEYERGFLFKYKDTEQVHLNIAFDNAPAGDDVRFPMNIINAALGGNLNARLFQKIREEMGLTYSIYSYGSSFNKAGLFHIYASMNPSQVGKVLKGIYDVIRDLCEKGIEEAELERIKKQLKTEIILTGESVSAKMNSNAKSFLMLNRVEEIDEIIEKNNRVTVKEIKECLNKYLDVSKCSVCLIGDIPKEEINNLKKEWNMLR